MSINKYLNKIICGDCLEKLQLLPDESIDLIYLDPPFFSNRNYEIVWGNKAEMKAYGDRWKGGISVYIDWIEERVREMYRVLKPTGSIYLHCDKHANAYLKIMLDRIFGEKNFRNEIIWCYATGGASKRFFAQKHDNIFFYVKTNNYNFYPERVKEPRTEKSLERAKTPKGARITQDNVMKLPTDVWNIQALNPMAKERLGYPTQKPEELLKKIILVSSNKGDIILDAFVGGGTTCVVAKKLGRYYIGIDLNSESVVGTKRRLRFIPKEVSSFIRGCKY